MPVLNSHSVSSHVTWHSCSHYLLLQQLQSLPAAPALKSRGTELQQGWPLPIRDLRELMGKREMEKHTTMESWNKECSCLMAKDKLLRKTGLFAWSQRGEGEKEKKKKEYSHSFNTQIQLCMVQIGESSIPSCLCLPRSFWSSVAAGTRTFQRNLGILKRSSPELQSLA